MNQMNYCWAGKPFQVSSWLISWILGLTDSGQGGEDDSLLTVLFLVLCCGTSSSVKLFLPAGDPGESSDTLKKLKPGNFPKNSTETLL